MCERIAMLVAGEVGTLETRTFPDGESYVRVATNVARRQTVIVCSLKQPNQTFLPLAFLADTLRDLGATSVGMIAPYLAYMRQDARFKPGEAVTSRSFADMLSRRVDWLLTVDPHLHRIAALTDLYLIPAHVAHAARDIGRWIADNVPSPLIIGPDAESAQWANDIAQTANAPATVLSKTRRGDTDVIESIPNLGDHRSRTPVLVDDIISTGRTMVAALEHLSEQGARAAWCIGVHAVFADDAYDALKGAGAERVVTTNTIRHLSNGIDITPLIATQLRRLLSALERRIPLE
jgi:ribose-phosphate pyrophosphokinase